MVRYFEEKNKLFVVSIKLGDASSGLDQLIAGENLSDVMVQKLRWAGSILAGVDKQSFYNGESSLNGVESTELAPYFYDALISLGYQNRPSFLDNFYLLLKSGGDAEIAVEEILQGKTLLKKMADDAFTALMKHTYR